MSRGCGRVECERSQRAFNPQDRAVLGGLEAAQNEAWTGANREAPGRRAVEQHRVVGRNRLAMAKTKHKVLAMRILRHMQYGDAKDLDGVEQSLEQNLGLGRPVVRYAGDAHPVPRLSVRPRRHGVDIKP